MSRFHVESVLKQFPELIGILGKKKIAELRHAEVKRIPVGWEMENGYNSPHFLISHDGTLLAKVETTLTREIWPMFFKKKETILDAVRRCGAKNVAYIAQYDEGVDCCGMDAPCALYIFKAPKDQSHVQLIASAAQGAQKQIAN